MRRQTRERRTAEIQMKKRPVHTKETQDDKRTDTKNHYTLHITVKQTQ